MLIENYMDADKQAIEEFMSKPNQTYDDLLIDFEYLNDSKS
jgi:hypothetical protein